MDNDTALKNCRCVPDCVCKPAAEVVYAEEYCRALSKSPDDVATLSNQYRILRAKGYKVVKV